VKLPRIHARITFNAPARLEKDGASFAYEVANLSAGGALLLDGATLDVGSEVTAHLQLSNERAVDVRARVVRHELLPDDRKALAVAFLDLSQEAEVRLSRAVTDSYQALGARVLGLVRTELQRSGITDIAAVAEELQRIKEEQARAHLFAGELFTETGSDAAATIVSPLTGERRDCIVWSLNLYLGLNRNPRIIERAQAALASFGTGCGTSAPSGGLNSLHQQIATRVAAMVGKPKAILLSTGYSANLGALSTLPGPKDLILLDREAHASMFDGVRLSGRKWLAFKHNDVADLEDKLLRYGPLHENVLVVVESAYSMSGDLSPLREIVALKKKHRFYLYVDEAHTFGFYGEGGRGYCWEQGVTDAVDFIMSTFSKSTASVGGFVACAEKYCTLLQATATPYIFQACLTPPDAATILAALDEIRDHPEHARVLHENNRLMRTLLVEEGFDLGESKSPVIPVYVPDLERLYLLCGKIYQEGIFSVPVVYPAVGPNEGRIRFIVNSHHTAAQVHRTVDALARHARALGIIGGNDMGRTMSRPVLRAEKEP